MLTDAEKLRIREEESFRHIVHDELSQRSESEPGSGAWKFLNSAFGIFLLSTVAVGMFTWAYQRFEAGIQDEKTRIRTRERIQAELEYRLMPLSGLMTDRWSDLMLALHQARKILAPSPREGERYDRVLSPEFAARSIPSLLFELKSLELELAA